MIKESLMFIFGMLGAIVGGTIVIVLLSIGIIVAGQWLINLVAS